MARIGLCLWSLSVAAAAAQDGRYSRRQANRGETTATSAKLAAHAFIDDTRRDRLRLVTFVDAAGLREPLFRTVLPLRVGVSYKGRGPTLQLRPSAFQLEGEGLAEPVRALSQEELLALEDGAAAVSQAALLRRARHAPQPFGPEDGLRVPTRFHSDPSRSTALNDETELRPGTWFTDVLFFEVPESFDRWGPLLTLRFVTAEEREPLSAVHFRVEKDSDLNRKAFRRARKARKQEEKQARREAKQAAREAARSR